MYPIDTPEYQHSDHTTFNKFMFLFLLEKLYDTTM